MYLPLWMMNPYIRDILMLIIFFTLLLFVSLWIAILIAVIYMVIRSRKTKK